MRRGRGLPPRGLGGSPSLAIGRILLPARREDSFIAGLSMGGYGAYRVALERPEGYACAASLSGVMDLATVAARPGPPSPFDFPSIFSDPTALAGTEADLFALVARLRAEGRVLPRLFQSCGTEDFLLDMNREAARRFAELAPGHLYREHPGEHNWDYWDAHIGEVLDWLPLKNDYV